MHVSQRTGPIRKMVLHTNEGGEYTGSAVSLRDYLYRNGPSGGGYQTTHDDRITARVVGDDVVCYANGAINHESVDGCIVGFAAQTAQQWADVFDAGDGHEIPGAIEMAARQFADWGRRYGIPAVILSGNALHDHNAKGITTHGLLTAAGFSGTDGHTDPGPNFPLQKFATRVGELINPQVNLDVAALIKLDNWRHRVWVRPLYYGDRNGDVQIMNDLLFARHFLKRSGNAYGEASRAAVYKFKSYHRWPQGPEHSGKGFGGVAADVMLGGKYPR